MKGYPLPSSKLYFKQSDIVNYIVTHNFQKEKNIWHFDPYALTTTLNSLNKPPSGVWIDVSNTPKEEVLHKLLCWMASYKYPALMCPQKADHWILLVAYLTQDDPRVVTDTTLTTLIYYDPDPDTGGEIAAPGLSVWWPDYLGWDPCPDGQIWKNKWVGIGEPPEEKGSINVEVVSRVGKKLIDPRNASGIATRFLNELRQKEVGLSLAPLGKVEAAQSMLVRDLSVEEKNQEDNVPRYYVVPFIRRYSVDETGTPLAWLSVLVNAYTGRFEGLHIFHEPVRYLSNKEAIKIARANLRLSIREAKSMKVELIFSPLRGFVSGALPAWKVTIQDRAFFITQKGIMLRDLTKISLLGA
jgi:hypothetical protein